jgi:hypothetical protein
MIRFFVHWCLPPSCSFLPRPSLPSFHTATDPAPSYLTATSPPSTQPPSVALDLTALDSPRPARHHCWGRHGEAPRPTPRLHHEGAPRQGRDIPVRVHDGHMNLATGEEKHMDLTAVGSGRVAPRRSISLWARRSGRKELDVVVPSARRRAHLRSWPSRCAPPFLVASAASAVWAAAHRSARSKGHAWRRGCNLPGCRWRLIKVQRQRGLLAATSAVPHAAEGGAGGAVIQGTKRRK